MGQGLGRAGRQAGRRSTAVYSASGPGQVGLGTTWGRRRPGARFPDLGLLPPELGVEILSHLNATDLCLASCVWHELATAEPLWQGLCKSNWGYCTIYHRRHSVDFSYRHLYLQLDEGCLTFNADPFEGIGYLFSRGILADNAQEIGRFIFSTETLHWQSLRLFLDRRRDVLDELVKLHNFANQFLPNALRQFFQSIRAPEERGEFLEALITKFSQRFCACNLALTCKLGLSPVMTRYQDILLRCNPALNGHLTLTHEVCYYSVEFRMGLK
uniref:F-box protein 8 n=1 Tax=Eptatretus burgeri TaxID=7764 RepID=A0A8C4WXE8_EPTBU